HHYGPHLLRRSPGQVVDYPLHDQGVDYPQGVPDPPRPGSVAGHGCVAADPGRAKPRIRGRRPRANRLMAYDGTVPARRETRPTKPTRPMIASTTETTEWMSKGVEVAAPPGACSLDGTPGGVRRDRLWQQPCP